MNGDAASAERIITCQAAKENPGIPLIKWDSRLAVYRKKKRPDPDSPVTIPVIPSE